MDNIKLYNGVELPLIGIGTDRIKDLSEVKTEILDALDVGYRMIDTASFYGNEEMIGEAIRESGVPRDQIFIATKVWYTEYEDNLPMRSVIKSMRNLGTDYIDMVMVHWPLGNYYNCYRQLEDLYEDGAIRAIGVSNFEPVRYMDLTASMRIKPMVNQIEVNILNQQKETRARMKDMDIAVQAYSPLANRRNDFFEQLEIIKFAEEKGKSVAQVALRFLIQEGISIVPKSVHRERIEQNFDIFDFELSETEVEYLRGLDKGIASIGSSDDPKIAEGLINLMTGKL